jgi:SAM-dependent methyltransferase
MQPVEGDALGSALLAALDGRAPSVVIERDDGFVDVDGTDYFGGLTEPERHALASATGRVLDVGAGAGRGALVLQERGQRVTALDVSAGAVEACRRRGVRNVYHGTLAQAASDGLADVFDSAVLLGNNVGLLGSRENAPAFLADLARLVKPDGVVAGVILDPYGPATRSTWPTTTATASAAACLASSRCASATRTSPPGGSTGSARPAAS